MKEIIYLDTKLVNSLLAQIDQGLILKQIAEESNSQGTHEETSNQESYSAGGRLGAPLFSGNVSNTEITVDKTKNPHTRHRHLWVWGAKKSI